MAVIPRDTFVQRGSTAAKTIKGLFSLACQSPPPLSRCRSPRLLASSRWIPCDARQQPVLKWRGAALGRDARLAADATDAPPVNSSPLAPSHLPNRMYPLVSSTARFRTVLSIQQFGWVLRYTLNI